MREKGCRIHHLCFMREQCVSDYVCLKGSSVQTVLDSIFENASVQCENKSFASNTCFS